MYYGRHAKHIARALAVASTSTQNQQHGCVISHNGKVLAVGVNSSRNPPRVCSDPETESGWHSEIAAIRTLPEGTDFSRLTLYSARVMKSGKPGTAKPCSNCQRVITALGFKDVIYT